MSIVRALGGKYVIREVFGMRKRENIKRSFLLLFKNFILRDDDKRVLGFNFLYSLFLIEY